MATNGWWTPKTKDIAQIVGGVVLVIGLIFGMLSISAWIFETLWNLIIVELFNAPVVSFWQSMGIVVLLSFVGGIVRGNSK